MRELEEPLPNAASVSADASLDLGLRAYLLATYNKVALGLALAGGLAYATANVPVLRDALFRVAATGDAAGSRLTMLGVCVAISPVIVLLLSGGVLGRATPRSTGAVYWTVVSLFGAAMGVLVLNFTGLSIATTFALSAAAFGGLSLFGYATRQDLTGLRSFLTVGVIGLLGALALNIVLRSPALEFATNTVGVLVFAGLIAFDTQRLKATYYKLGGDEASLAVASNYGALALFINFLNLFQFLLAMMSGERR